MTARRVVGVWEDVVTHLRTPQAAFVENPRCPVRTGVQLDVRATVVDVLGLCAGEPFVFDAHGGGVDWRAMPAFTVECCGLEGLAVFADLEVGSVSLVARVRPPGQGTSRRAVVDVDDDGLDIDEGAVVDSVDRVVVGIGNPDLIGKHGSPCGFIDKRVGREAHLHSTTRYAAAVHSDG